MSLATVLESLHDKVRTALVAPSTGQFVDRVRERECVDEHIVIPSFGTTSRLKTRIVVTYTLLRWLAQNHRRLAAVHANGDAELKLVLPVIPALRAPIVVWYHSREVSPSTRRLSPLWKVLSRRIRWATVSIASREQLALAGVDPSRVAIVPNPIDALTVTPESNGRSHDPPLVVGYLGCEFEVKGIQLLPEIAIGIADLPARILCVTKGWPAEDLAPVVGQALDRLHASSNVDFTLRDFAVRNIYGRIDCLLIPSLSESFCRIAAEAMVIGLPVVASDLPAIREVTGDGAAALLFPPGDAAAASDCLRMLVNDSELRVRLGEQGRSLGKAFEPATVMALLLDLYGVKTSA
jgi:glycosyltransferase involved in cell wall biosynthesis